MRAYEMSAAAGLGSWTLAERPTLEPGRGQVLVRLRAASLNYRDLLIAQGQYPFSVNLDRLIPVSDGAGEIVAVGEGVRRFRGGERVAGIFSQSWLGGAQVADMWQTALGGAIDGVLSEFQVFDEAGLVTLPDALSFEEGATLPCAAVTAWNALYGLKLLRAGETVLTLGTGGVSIFALQFAKAMGATVIATSSSDEKLERLKALGADHVINYRSEPNWGDAAARLTGGRGVDHVVEIGGPGTLEQSIAAVRIGGHISLIGIFTGLSGEIPTFALMAKQARLQGLIVGSRRQQQEMVRAVEASGIRPVIDQSFPLEGLVDAFRYQETNAHFGKICLEF